MSSVMDLDNAKEAFLEIIAKLREEDRSSFSNFMEYVMKESFPNVPQCPTDTVSESVAMEMIQKIRNDLRSCLPLNAILPSENITFPSHGEHADASPRDTCHVDAFLYDDSDIDDLCDAGQLTRHFCRDCGSRNLAPLNFITHSMSENQLKFIFRHVLRDSSGKNVMDVGSRIGAVLYGAYFYSSAARIVGVEMNSDLCNLQSRIIQTYQLSDRVQIVCDDVCNQVELLNSADVIIMHNVFEFFVPEEAQVRIWNHLRKTIRPGTVMVLSPSLPESVTHLQVDFSPGNWLLEQDVCAQRKLAITALEASEDEINSLHFYTVR